MDINTLARMNITTHVRAHANTNMHTHMTRRPAGKQISGPSPAHTHTHTILLACRRVDLGPLLSAHHLAEQAVDLNLMLMRWRAAPDLNVEVMSRTKCLLLGERNACPMSS